MLCRVQVGVCGEHGGDPSSIEFFASVVRPDWSLLFLSGLARSFAFMTLPLRYRAWTMCRALPSVSPSLASALHRYVTCHRHALDFSKPLQDTFAH